jgi:hypothetical protein
MAPKAKEPSARVLHALDLLRKMRYSAAVTEQREKFSICRTTACEDLSKADALLAEEVRRQLPQLAERSIERMARVMDRAEAKGDDRAVVMAQRELTRISGIAAPDKIEHSGSVAVTETIDLSSATMEELEAIVAKIEGRKS